MKNKKTNKFIGINCLDVDDKYVGGINTFLYGILDGLDKNNYNKKIIIYCSNKNYTKFEKYKSKFKIKKFDYNRKFYYFFYVILSFLNFEKLFISTNKLFTKKIFDEIYKETCVLYTPTSVLTSYFFKGKNIVSPHDFQHIYYRENFNIFRLKYRYLSYKLTIKFSDLIQVSSNMIKNDVLKNYKINRKKIFLMSEGVDLDEFKAKNNKKKNLVFFPAYWWPHKNHKFIIKCFMKLIFKEKVNCKLIMCGGINFTEKQKMLKLQKKTQGRISHIGIVSKMSLINLYRRSRLVISPATYESSSLPILEAIACNTPVIASNTKPNIELNKKLDITLYKLNNSNSFIRSFKEIWFNKSTYRKQTFFNKKALKEYSWKLISQKYFKIFLKL
ncbi:glycosyltransferase [Pelagibacterales bacterium SAG-MED10]|nr:glycosyltransferase [Pelagibacterales bacterium SAG-MED10]